MDGAQEYWLTRFVFQRGMGLVYLMAFLNALNQFRPLLGERGLLPVPTFVKFVPFQESPSLFYFLPTNTAFTAAACAGILLSCLALTGLSDRYGLWLSVLVWGLLWILYLSFVNVGQTFYAFGWESILLEAGFYTIFLGSSRTAVPVVMIWILRWLVFRVMFGAGLIKLRGDSCWKDLTCLNYHYETQPMPNPLSWYLHWAPEWTRRAGVAFNHFAEIVAPFGYFIPGPVSAAAGLVTVFFQGMIMISGNLSWLNFLTIILAIPLFNDRWLGVLIPMKPPLVAPADGVWQAAPWVLAAVVAAMSYKPIRNMLSPRQIMNTSYNPLHLVGTYGAFGSITRTRYEVVVEGTQGTAAAPAESWKEYEFRGKPGDPAKRPPQIAPYHLRIDWLMWFAAMSGPRQHPWFVRMVQKLLEGDKDTLRLLRENPFPDAPPRFIRARLYEYHFTSPQERKKTGRWWKRDLAGEYFPAVSLE